MIIWLGVGRALEFKANQDHGIGQTLWGQLKLEYPVKLHHKAITHIPSKGHLVGYALCKELSNQAGCTMDYLLENGTFYPNPILSDKFV